MPCPAGRLCRRGDHRGPKRQEAEEAEVSSTGRPSQGRRHRNQEHRPRRSGRQGPETRMPGTQARRNRRRTVGLPQTTDQRSVQERQTIINSNAPTCQMHPCRRTSCPTLHASPTNPSIQYSTCPIGTIPLINLGRDARRELSAKNPTALRKIRDCICYDRRCNTSILISPLSSPPFSAVVRWHHVKAMATMHSHFKVYGDSHFEPGRSLWQSAGCKHGNPWPPVAQQRHLLFLHERPMSNQRNFTCFDAGDSLKNEPLLTKLVLVASCWDPSFRKRRRCHFRPLKMLGCQSHETNSP